MPDTFIMSVAQQLSDRWQMLGDVSWTGWSSIPKVDIMRASGAQSGTVAQVLDTDFRDTWRVALGTTYKLNDAMKLKFGMAYDQTPVKGASTRLTSLPDNNRTWFSAGAQWIPSKGSALDLGVTYIYLKDADINNNQALSGRGSVVGTYSDSVWILGGQYSMAF
jgi:long-chain fatty acid transport protein